MIRIRKNVFETNSSSTHSVTIGGGAEPSTLSFTCDDITNWEEGIVIDTVGFCGWNNHDTQEEKLAYLMQQLAYINGFHDIFWSSPSEERLQEFYECDDFKELEEAICDYTGAKCLRFGNLGGYIDHDSIVYDIYELKDEVDNSYTTFVFSPDSYVHFEFCG